jgi:hypothetical protein
MSFDFISDDAIVCEIDSIEIADKLQADADEILISAMSRMHETRR